jgi:hypothetical protein
MAPLFFAIGVITAIWSAVRSQVIYRQLIDSFAPQFQDELTSRYAFHVYALSPSTPLPLQAEYMKVLYCGCVCPLCISLGLFSLGNVVLGCFILLGFVLAAFSTFKSWKTYRANCVRPKEQAEP